MNPDRSTTDIEIVLSVEAGGWPPENELDRLVESVVGAVAAEDARLASGPTELSVVFTDDAHVKALNAEWRGKDSATNVLSFPAFATWPGGRLPPMLGDIVLAFETVESEARLDRKPLLHHLTHLVAHGLLHLLGHDHEAETEAETMEALERRVLARLAIPDPYR